MYKDYFIKSVNWHVTSKCNYNCKFCHTINLDDDITEILDSKRILGKLNQLGIEKINIVGGEPLLYPFTYDIIKIAKKMGFITAINTNGSLLTKSKIKMFSPYLDWIGLSVDSKYEHVEKDMGRGCGNHVQKALKMSEIIKEAGIKLKINTTVTKLNCKENMNNFIRKLNPDKWENFQVLHIKEQNENIIRSLSISGEEFKYYTNLNKDIILRFDEKPVFKRCEDMVDQNIMLPPHGDILINANNMYERYSLNLLDDGKDVACLIHLKKLCYTYL